ncbi:MAG TPA: hypothetical protein VNX67_01105, partial [Solirubrobacteraceae bacterium]|nr:hypothetical protein [Solirubrobacteraceae bacterium]
LDTDYIDHTGAFPSGVNWLQKIWYDELAQQWDPDNLPHSTPVTGSGRCGFRSLRVGVVTVCAERIEVSGSVATASGNVVLDDGVGVGGSLEIDMSAKHISMNSPASITILRPSGPLTLGTGALSIEAEGTTEPISGKTGVAKTSVTNASLGGLGSLRVGGLPISLPTTGSVATYLDGANGGGLIASGSVDLSMLGSLKPSGSLALGTYAGSPHPVVPLGGSAHLGAINFGGGWGFSGLDLSYQAVSDTWSASGGLSAPIGSLDARGSVIGGALDSLSVHIGGQNVPLADSGFFLSGFGGGLSGLVHGPLAVNANTEGFWGAPDLPVEPFYLDNLGVTLSLGGAISFDGAVSFVLKDGSPLHGQLHLHLHVSPFSAGGSASAEGKLPGISLKVGGGAGFSARHFTLSEYGMLSAFGLSGKGQAILSDKGLGASGELCAPAHVFCQTLAMTETWRQLRSLQLPTLVGAQPTKLITVPGVASARRLATVRVSSGRSLLLIDATGAGAPIVGVRDPSGRLYGAGSHRVIIVRQPEFGLTTIAVPHPRPGTWHVELLGPAVAGLTARAVTVQPIALIQTGAITPSSTRRHRLAPKTSIRLRWESRGLPSGVRLSLVRRRQPHEAGAGLAGDLSGNGALLVPARRLAVGPNYLSLAASQNGIPFQQVTFSGTVWRASSSVPRRRR